MMKKVTFLGALKNFSKEQLLPALGKAYAVFTLAKILALEAAKSQDPNNIYQQLMNIISDAGDKHHIWAVIFVGALFILALLVQLFSLFWKPARPLFKLASRYGHWPATGVGALLGTLLVPLTIYLALSLAEPSIHFYLSNSFLIFLLIAFAYFVLSFAIYYINNEYRENVANAVIFSVEGKEGKIPNAVDVCEILNQNFKGKEFGEIDAWLGEVVVLADTDDGQIVVAIPVRYSVQRWTEADCKNFIQACEKFKSTLETADYHLIKNLFSPQLKSILSKTNAAI